MSRAKELLRLAERVGLSVTPHNGKLIVKGPKSFGWIVEQIREYREEILSLCTREKGLCISESNLTGDSDTSQRNPGNNVLVSPVTPTFSPVSGGCVESWTDEDNELSKFVLALVPDDLPTPPFQLHPWAEVLDNERYLAWLKRDVALGSQSPRSRYGVLHQDMKRLREIVQQQRTNQ